MFHFLVLDEERLLSSLMKPLQQLFQFTLKVVGNIAEVKNHLQCNAVDAVFLAGISDSQAEEFLRWYRGELVSSIPLVLVLAEVGIERYVRYKKELFVDYLFFQPVDQEEILSVLRRLCHTEPSEEREMGEIVSEALMEKYKNAIVSKLGRLEASLKLLEKETSIHLLKEFKLEIHKIAGSAGAYGYLSAGNLCKSCELTIHGWLSEEKISNVRLEHLQLLRLVLKKLYLAFQHLKIDPVSELKTGPIPRPYPLEDRPLSIAPLSSVIFLVEGYHTTTDLFQKICAQQRVPLVIEPDAERAKKTLISQDFFPIAIIVKEEYLLAQLTGKELIFSYQTTHPNKHPVTAMLVQEEDLKEWAKHSVEGVDYFFKLPLTEEVVTEFINSVRLRKKASRYRVLIVDDDPDISILTKGWLEEIGLYVETLEDERKIFESLAHFAPDILLLDLQMPNFNGWQLLKTLRSDIRYSRLIVILYTVSRNAEILQRAYKEGCDEIFFKPVDKTLLQNRITYLLNRFTSIGGVQSRDPQTGHHTLEDFIDLFNEYLLEVLREDKRFAYIHVEIPIFENLLTQISTVRLNELLLSVSSLLKKTFSGSIIDGYLGMGKFGFIFEKMSGGEAEFLVENFLSVSGRELRFVFEVELAITFRVGVCLCDGKNLTVEKIMQTAQNMAVDAKPIEIGYLTDEEKNRRPIFPQVFLIDDDRDLLDILTNIFQTNGYLVTAFQSGQEAMDYFSKVHSLNGRCLFVIDRVLADMDGLEVLRHVRQKFPKQVTAIFLSALSTERDILDGLQEGALDYIIKPFSSAVLLQKSHMLLNR